MGEIAVLNPQNVLGDRFPPQNFIHSAMKSRQNSNPKPNYNSNPILNLPNDHRRKRSPTKVQKKNRNSNYTGGKTVSLVEIQSPVNRSNLVMGQVKILKRGEALTETRPVGLPEKPAARSKSPVPKVEKNIDRNLALSSTARLGPEPEMVPKKVDLPNFYAGSAAFVTSPPPSSLPLPGFFKKKTVLGDINAAETDLRRILRLDLA